MASSSWTDYGPSSPVHEQQPSDSRSKKVNHARQLLSCTKCRERKVKCDRTKPCSACCARGHPKECEFMVGEDGDYGPIQQSYEIRKLRQENQRLKERLRAVREGESDDGGDGDSSEQHQRHGMNSLRLSGSRQRGLKAVDRVDNLYFGTPGLASIVSDFASLQVGTHSLTHTIPKGRDLYAADSTSYPFPVIFTHSSSSALLELLPPREELLEYVDLFQSRAQACTFLHTSEQATKKEIERFLDDAERNAQKAPDMLALIFCTLAMGLQMGQYDANGAEWNATASETARRRGDAFLAASMQSLRNASFLNMPTLLGIQTLVMMGPYLTNSGRFLDAWTLFGTTIRLAHSIGLHRNPNFLDPVPPLHECSVRQTLWWWMLHMDQQYSITLGRPLGISGIGDCPPPRQLTPNPTMLRLGDFTNHFTILARQICSSDGMMAVSKTDDFTDKLLGLWDTMPSTLQFDESWVRSYTPLPEWPMEVMSTTLFVKIQSLLILLNRQRIERTQDCSPEAQAMAENFFLPAPVRGRALVILSSIQIIKAFMFLKHRNPQVLICWALGQHAFNACMILLLDAWETHDDQNEWLVSQAYTVFRELELNGVHNLAALAVERISEGVLRLGQRRDEWEKMEWTAYAQQQQASSSSMQDDSTPMSDWSSDAVMGNTRMFLLEDNGLQSYVPQQFQPLPWSMVGDNSEQFDTSQFATDVPRRQVMAAMFPLAPAPFAPPLPLIPPTGSPYAVGLRPRMPALSNRRPQAQTRTKGHGVSLQAPAFTPINNTARVHNGYLRHEVGTAGHGSTHRLERPPRSTPRRG